jgi:hypothetical protein
MHAAGFFGMGMDVDRHDVFDVGQFQFGHFRFPDGRLIFRPGKLIIVYNKFRKTAEDTGSGSR